MEAVYLMLVSDEPRNYVISTCETHSVREFVELAFKEIGIEIEWSGTGIDEVGNNKATGEVVVKVNSRYYRDIDIECLIGDASKAKRILGWEPRTSFKDVVREMVLSALSSSSTK
jgi:GDPmannose 4,6-dehydratase